MRKLFLLLLISSNLSVIAQNNLTTTIIEGGKTLVDLVRVFKTPKANIMQTAATSTSTAASADSCYSKGLADITYKNTSGKSMQVSLYKRNGTVYATAPLTLRISNNSQESLYEISSGIYKYKIEYDEVDNKKIIFKEGEIKIQSCDKLVKEIKKE
ncbi:MAG: hypothetical protein IPP48_08575 [Chitinophagaceae bacterium]|nr:hypothetical protein [Chitinophagaceae bacterium]